jgi:hypothetical protein
MKYSICLLFTLSTIFLTSFPSYSADTLSFTCAFLYKTESGEIKAFDEITGSATLTNKDQLKIFLCPEENAFIYILLLDAEQDLTLIFPRFLSDFEDNYSMGRGVYIPRGLTWFTLEGKGEERFYIIASSFRLSLLEKYIVQYRDIKEAEVKGSKIEDVRQKVLDEIRRLQVEHFALIQKTKPEIRLVAGEIRGLAEGIEFPAWRIRDVAFYCRVIRIEH